MIVVTTVCAHVHQWGCIWYKAGAEKHILANSTVSTNTIYETNNQSIIMHIHSSSTVHSSCHRCFPITMSRCWLHQLTSIFAAKSPSGSAIAANHIEYCAFRIQDNPRRWFRFDLLLAHIAQHSTQDCNNWKGCNLHYMLGGIWLWKRLLCWFCFTTKQIGSSTGRFMFGCIIWGYREDVFQKQHGQVCLRLHGSTTWWKCPFIMLIMCRDR